MSTSFSDSLRRVNLKSTPKRLAILGALADERAYASPEEIWQKLKESFSCIGLPTVYRNLEELAGAGMITKIIHPNRQLYYHFCTNSTHHHHFICVSCRKVEDVDFCGLDAVQNEIARRFGGKVLSHIVQVNGLCGDCSATAGDA